MYDACDRDQLKFPLPSLRCMQSSGDGLGALFLSLKDNRSLRKLDVSGTEMQMSAVECLGKVLQFRSFHGYILLRFVLFCVLVVVPFSSLP